MDLLYILEGTNFVNSGGDKSKNALSEIILDMGGKSMVLFYSDLNQVINFILKKFFSRRKIQNNNYLVLPLLDSRINSTNFFLIFKSNLKLLLNKLILYIYLKLKLFEIYQNPKTILVGLNFEEAVIFFRKLFPNSKILWLTRSSVNCLIWSSARMNISKYKRIIRQVDGIATTTKETYLMYKDYFLINNLDFEYHELHVPINHNGLINKIVHENYKNRIKVISIFGSLGPRKGIFYLLDLCKEINKYYAKTVEVDIFGLCPSQYNFLKNFNKKTNNLKINIHGFIDKKYSLKLYKNATVAIFPSYSENMSRAHRDCALLNIPVFINAKSFDSTLLGFPRIFQSFFSKNDLLNLMDNYFINPNEIDSNEIKNNENLIRKQLNQINN